ncbi:MAG: AarF/ABC1/UbiB kinase family protein [Planctomycetes bacterium]|nr:AarF/ABC1/UbiB kinase family protein [Planctomycetota bacterium]
MTPLQFTRSVRSLNRLRQVAMVLTQHGFGHVVARINLARFVPVWMLRRGKRRPETAETPTSIGRHIVDICTELGPTFIKLGQLLSTRPDVVPADVLGELRRLQDDVAPFDGAVALQSIAKELGRPVEECFAFIESTPIASGSIGQVHRAVARDGTQLVVKVRRPGIEDVIKLDMQLLAWLAQSLESLVPELNVYRPTLLVAELEQMLTRELDYINEASATSRFARAFAGDEGIRIPRVYWDLTGPRVLTLEALSGTNASALTDGADVEGIYVDRRLIARRIAECFLKQVFELGVFHADPHPGNLLIDPPATVGLIDFGQTGGITDDVMTQIVVLVYGAVSREVDVVIDGLADLGALGAETDRRQLHRALQTLLDKYYGLPLKRLDPGTLMSEFSEVVRHHDVVVPRDVLMLFKAMGLVAGICARLDPELIMLELLDERLRKVLRERLSPPRLARGAALWSWHLLSIARQAPGQLREGMRRLAAGGWRLRIRHENIDRLTNELDRSSNRLAFSVVIAAIIVGSSVVVSANTSLTVFDIKFQYFGIVGYLIAGVLGLGLSWAIFRSGRLH